MRFPLPFLFLSACLAATIWASSPVTTELLQGDWLLEQQRPTAGQLHIISRRHAGAPPTEVAEMTKRLYAIEAMFESYGQAIEIRGRTLYRTEAVRQFGMALKQGRHFNINGNALEFEDGSPRILIKVGASSMLQVEPANPATGQPEVRRLYKRIDRGVRPWTHHVIATAVPADVKVNHQRVPGSPKPAMATGSVSADPTATTPPAPAADHAPSTPDSPITGVPEPGLVPGPPTTIDVPDLVEEPAVAVAPGTVVEIDVPDIGLPTTDPLIEIDVPDLAAVNSTTSVVPDLPDIPDLPDLPAFDDASTAAGGAPLDLSLPPVPAPDAEATEPGPPPAFAVPPVIIDVPPTTPPAAVADSAPESEPPEPDVGLPDFSSIDFPEIPTTEIAAPEPAVEAIPEETGTEQPDLSVVPNLPDVPSLPDLPAADIGAPSIDLPAPPPAAAAEVTPAAIPGLPDFPDLLEPAAPTDVTPDGTDLALPDRGEEPVAPAIPDLPDLPASAAAEVTPDATDLPFLNLPEPPVPATAEVTPVATPDLDIPDLPDLPALPKPVIAEVTPVDIPDLPDLPALPKPVIAEVTPIETPDLDLPDIPDLDLPDIPDLDLPGIPVADTGNSTPVPTDTEVDTTAAATPDLDLPDLNLPDAFAVTPAVKSDDPDTYIRANITSLAESQFPDDKGLAWNVEKIKKINGHTYVEVSPKPASVGYDRLVFVLSFEGGNPTTAQATYAFEDDKFVLFSTAPDVPDGKFPEELRNW